MNPIENQEQVEFMNDDEMYREFIFQDYNEREYDDQTGEDGLPF